MHLKAIGAVCIAMAAMPAPVFANGGDIVGGFIAGMIGAAIVNDAQRHSHRTYAMSSAQRDANVEVQTALNYFGYDVGTPDGVLGARSQRAVESCQALLGDPVSGQLNDYEHSILITAYHRGMAGGPAVSQLILTDPLGARALLLQQRNEMAGIQAPAPAPTSAAPAPEASSSSVPGQSASGSASQSASGSALPSFMGAGATQVSLASHCNKVSLQTNANGGFVTEASMTDPEFALSEQFCLARTYAMSASEDLQAKISGFTPQQIQDQCASFGPLLKDYVSAVSLKPEAEVLSSVQTFAMNSGMAPAQLAATAKICLGVGYTTDNMDVAVGSALLLTALGQNSYAEFLGHHLSLGFGTSQRRDLALAWYDTALKAIAAGEVAVAPGMPDRAKVLQKAAYLVSGAAVPLDKPKAVTVALPNFTANP